MLSINQKLFAIEDAMEEVVVTFLQLDSVQQYKKVRRDFLLDDELQKSILAFQDLQDNYQEVKDFTEYRPEVQELRRHLFQKKRELDIHKKVVKLRQSEVAVQEVLASLSQRITIAVSGDIFVDTGLPLAPHKPSHQKGWGHNIKEG